MSVPALLSMKTTVNVLGVVVGVVAVGGACDPLAGADYFGEPLLTLDGEVKTELPEALVLSELDVAVVWISDDDADTDGFAPVTERAVVEGRFPARFTLQLFRPPGDNAVIHTESGAPFGYGFVVARFPTDEPTALDLDTVMGVSERYVVVSIAAEDDIDDIVAFAPALHALEVGFNLVDLNADNDSFRSCREEAIRDITSCETACQDGCPADDACLDPCIAECSALFSERPRSCEALLEAVVPTSTLIDLTLNPEAVATSNLGNILRPGDDGDVVDEPVEEGDTP